MKIRVTRRHIAEANRKRETAFDNGEYFNICRECPVAVAVSARCGKEVDAGFTRVTIGDSQWKLPQVVSSFIYAWDGRKPVKPFTFELEIPQ